MVDVYINWRFSLMLIPVAALGHFVGLRVHDNIIENDTKFNAGWAVFLYWFV